MLGVDRVHQPIVDGGVEASQEEVCLGQDREGVLAEGGLTAGDLEPAPGGSVPTARGRRQAWPAGAAGDRAGLRLLVLGAGWIGEALVERHPGSVGTHRQGPRRFDLGDEATWDALPALDATVWTFPAAPPGQAVRLYESKLAGRPCVVLGSTSAYAVESPEATVDEASPLDLSQPRVRGEEALRARGAMVLHLAGLWGPGRDPERWLVEGRIRNGAKRVNLAHRHDVVAAIEAVLVAPRPGLRLNVSDGLGARWSEHVEALRAAGRLPPEFRLPEAPPGAGSRIVSNQRLRELLPGRRLVRFPDGV
jgi:hypothetical protein